MIQSNRRKRKHFYRATQPSPGFSPGPLDKGGVPFPVGTLKTFLPTEARRDMIRNSRPRVETNSRVLRMGAIPQKGAPMRAAIAPRIATEGDGRLTHAAEREGGNGRPDITRKPADEAAFKKRKDISTSHQLDDEAVSEDSVSFCSSRSIPKGALCNSATPPARQGVFQAREPCSNGEHC